MKTQSVILFQLTALLATLTTQFALAEPEQPKIHQADRIVEFEEELGAIVMLLRAPWSFDDDVAQHFAGHNNTDQGVGNWTVNAAPGVGGRNSIINEPLGPHTNKVVEAGADVSIKSSPPYNKIFIDRTSKLEQLQCDIYMRTAQVEICTIIDNDGETRGTGIAWICPVGRDCFFRDIDDSEGVIAKLQPG